MDGLDVTQQVGWNGERQGPDNPRCGLGVGENLVVGTENLICFGYLGYRYRDTEPISIRRSGRCGQAIS
jgi:hypothetical protein